MFLNKVSEVLRILWCNYDDYVGDDNYDNLIMSFFERKLIKIVFLCYFYVVLIVRLLLVILYIIFYKVFRSLGLYIRRGCFFMSVLIYGCVEG